MKKIIFLILLNCCCLSFLSGQFELIGSDDYGRIFSVTYDKTTPNKLYAATLGNQIVSSNNNGQSWDIFYSIPERANLYENQLKAYGNDMLSYTLRYSPFHSPIGRTIYMLDINTKNITHTYTAPADPDPDPEMHNYIKSYSISESDPNYALVSMGYVLGFDNWERVYYTTDGGDSWTEVYYSVNNFDIHTNEVAIHPEDPEKLYLTRANAPTEAYGGLLISEDGGQTWTEKLPLIWLVPITFNPSNPDEVWIGTGGNPEMLYKSTDAGESWAEISLPWTDYYGDEDTEDQINKIQFNPLNPLHMIVLERNEIAISHDGGNTWQLNVHQSNPENSDPENYFYGLSTSFNPFNENEVFISANYYPFFSTDKGETMQRIKTKYFPSEGNIQYFNNGEEEHLYYGVQWGFSHRNIQTLEENAYELLPINQTTLDPPITIVTDPHIAGRVYTYLIGGMGFGFKLSVSDSHGENPKEIYSTFSEMLLDAKSIPGSPDKIWASLVTYFDGAEYVEVYEIDFSDLENVQVSPVTLPNSSGALTSFLFGADANTAFAAKGSRVHKTTNGGTSWTEINNGLSTLHANNDMIYKLVENPLNENQISIASNKGIYTSEDGGANWTRINTTFAHNVKHSTVTNGHIIAATHDSDISEFGLRYSNDGGENWADIADEELMSLMSTNILSSTDFNFYDEFVDVFVATTGLGVIKFTIDLTTMKVIDSDLSAKKSTVIYPNPTTNLVNIESKENVSAVEILGLSGQKLINSNSKQINVSHLNKGIYIVKIQLQNGKTETHKLIKN